MTRNTKIRKMLRAWDDHAVTYEPAPGGRTVASCECGWHATQPSIDTAMLVGAVHLKGSVRS